VLVLLMREITHAVDIASGNVIYILSFMKTGSRIQIMLTLLPEQSQRL
jgi:hypothetical protein